MRALLWLIVALCLSAATGAPAATTDKGMIVLGIDGMDPRLLRQFMAEGRTPHLARLASLGGFIALETSIPPQSPVAWSNFITGMDPGHHGLFDFLALDRETMTPYRSSARVEPPALGTLEVGRWRIPLGSDTTLLLRDGRAFWEILDEAGVPTTIFRVPANYPPLEIDSGRAFSGMGTPDLRGSPGTFTYYTDARALGEGTVSGGEIHQVTAQDGVVRVILHGPPNGFLDGRPESELEIAVYLDPENPVAMIQVGDEQVLLNSGEWSDWVAVRFELVPWLVEVPGMVRFFLQQTSPNFALYVSPVNIDPRDPAQTIATPAEYGRELAKAVGPFYTQEMPEDTKALSARVITPRQFLQQSGLVLAERRRLLKHELKRFRQEQGRGLLFFYISSVDQRHHMMHRHMDATHPFHDDETPRDLAEAMRSTYEEMDELVGWLMEELDDTTLVVMSDHGFAGFHYQANLNTWLEQQGYLTLRRPERRDSYEWLDGVDWDNTRAFAIGLNSLYLNVRGRERFGIVDPGEREALAREIAAKLQQWTDERTGRAVVTQPVVREDVYSGPHVAEAPDIIVGYARGYRASWATTSGKVPAGLIEDNKEEWSGDHAMDAREVPGVVLSNRPIKIEKADLRDLTVSILVHFGVAPPEQMQGRSIF